MIYILTDALQMELLTGRKSDEVLVVLLWLGSGQGLEIENENNKSDEQ